MANFFKSIGKGLSKLAKGVGKVIGKVAQVAAPIASVIPGLGMVLSPALSIVGGLLGPKPKDPGVAAMTAPQQTLEKVPPGAGFGTLAALGLAAFFLLGKK